MYEQVLLNRLSRLYEIRSLLIKGRRRGFLEKDEAQRLIELLREIITDLSGGEALATLHLLDAAEELVREPGERVKALALEKFGRSNVIPMPEHLVEAFPEPSILEMIRSLPLARRIVERVVGLIAERMGLNPRVIEALLDIRLRDLVMELGYQLETLLDIAGDYARRLEDYILGHGLGKLKVSGSLLSVFTEVTGRAWLSVVRKGPWQVARPLARQAKRAQYEFDAVSYELVEDRVELHVAEIELKCGKFLELEERKHGKVTSIEGKVERLRHLLDTFREAYRRLGVRRACLKSLLLICYDKPPKSVKDEVVYRAKIVLDAFPREALCPGFSLEVIDGDELVAKLGSKPPENRLREAIKYIVSAVAANNAEEAMHQHGSNSID